MSPNPKKLLLYLVIIIFLALFINVSEEWNENDQSSSAEFIFDTVEKALILTGAGGVFLILKLIKDESKERECLLSELAIAKREGENWRHQAQSYINGVGIEIEKQFRLWELSSAESEVGLLIIKGFSHKEIADLRGTAEATVRQQARTIYKKSNLPGKSAFSAYFLEDLLPQRIN